MPAGPTAIQAPAAVPVSFRAMASQVTVRTGTGAVDAATFRAVAALFADVEAECTRFDPASPLMRANLASADPDGEGYRVPPYCYAAIEAAAEAYRVTDGLFDPRILTALRRLGYDRSLPEPDRDHQPVDAPPATEPAATGWRPELDPVTGRVRLGPDPIDLGGIGKGLAVRWSVQLLRRGYRTFLVEAGGDCYLAGAGPDGRGWQVGVEDPAGGSDPVAVLSLRDTACATSSIRLRRWTVAGAEVHHLIDPRTGRSAAGGLAAVTVIADDPAWAEVWSKTLFLTGQHRIEESAARHCLAAVWVNADGGLGWSAPAAELISWRGR
jgi:thiamine biosynthesis lipoprotein